MSLKDKGNECYKQLKYEEAINYYREYTREDHSDNKNAYNNMGLSYYKLKEYQLAAVAFENAVEEDR
jgi:tetratricopeptide (TPR) repeat protein